MEASRETLRIADANLNRAGEGLRVLEDLARLALNDEALSRKLKEMRHALLDLPAGFQEKLIGARDAAGDVGRDIKAPAQERQLSMDGIVVANSRRVQESLRVLEEMARTAMFPLDTDACRGARFSLYEVERDLLARLLRKDRLARLPGLYVIIDNDFLRGRDPAIVTGQAISGGATAIQLRAKDLEEGPFLAMAARVKEACRERGVLFTVNDSLGVALAAGADGLHLGQDDLPVGIARRLLPMDKLLGVSVRTIEEARRAREDGADYLGVGAIYATGTKTSAEAVGPGRLGEIKKASDLPMVAIGGINKGNIAGVMRAGAISAAVISAVMGAADVEAAARELTNIIEEVRGARPG